ncbi:hypothetical protein ABZV91_16560 [Nocardia sp. NPDC004568]|uniref:hypothetical protein n=1 Tax=Nocardia sp. NPDC004568 TaxID=3154551 RepID=UPI0033BEAF25
MRQRGFSLFALAALTALVLGGAVAPMAAAAPAVDTGSAGLGIPNPPPPPPEGGDGQHQPGEPCENGGHYEWVYNERFGSWYLVCQA